MSLGIEDTDDLIADIRQALEPTPGEIPGQ
jgi:cystathionine beta-lyase/cystathionine gamma-synthase